METDYEKKSDGAIPFADGEVAYLLSPRFEMAKAALQGILASGKFTNPRQVASKAVAFADMVLEVLKKTE